MALTKITANIIEDGAISTASLANTSITADKLAATLDLTGKTITVATATAGDNDTTVASTAFVSTAIANLADSAPATLDTLNELAAALGDDANFSTTVTNSIATKLPLAGGTLTGNLNFGDSDKAIFGAGSDLQIYHDGNSFIDEVGTGDLYIRGSNNIYFDDADSTHRYAQFISGGAVKLRYDNSAKFETTATGIDVTGTATMDGLSLDNAQYISFKNSSNASTRALGINGVNTFYVGGIDADIGDILFVDGGVARASFANGGDIKFYEDTGTTAKFFWDASAESLGIGTTSPATGLHVVTGGGTTPFRVQGGANVGVNIMEVGYAGGGAGANFIIDDNGRCGIGTSSPSRPLDVNGSGIVRGFMTLYGTGTNNALFLHNTAYEWAAYTNASNNFVIADWNLAQTRLTIDTSGNVGIGDTSPSVKLDVYQSTVGIGAADFRHVNGNRILLNPSYNYYDAYNHIFRYLNGSATYMTIANTGNIHINKTDINQTTTLGFDLYANGTMLSTHTVSNNESWIINNYNGSGTSRFDFRWNNSSRGGIDVTSTGVTYDTNSDYRLKENVDYTWDATTRLKQLKPARFNWIADDTNTLVDGFLAHEVASVVPNAVTGTKDGTYDSEHDLAGQEKYQGIDHSKLVPLLVKTIQELEARITALES